MASTAENGESSGGRSLLSCGQCALDPSLPQEKKIDLGKGLMGRVRAAYEEAHVQDTTEERVVHDRRGPNEATSRGGWPSTGASCALSRVSPKAARSRYWTNTRGTDRAAAREWRWHGAAPG
jgi:hypothetical protein